MRHSFCVTLVSSTAQAQVNAGDKTPEPSLPFTMTQVATFNLPWRIAFLPDGRMLVTEKVGPVWLVTQQGAKTPVANVPAVLYQGQGGMLGVYVSPRYATDQQRLPHLFGAGRRRVEPGARAGPAVDRPGHGEPRGIAGAVAPDAQGQGRTVRRRDRVFSRRPVPVPDGRRSPAHDARAGSRSPARHARLHAVRPGRRPRRRRGGVDPGDRRPRRRAVARRPYSPRQRAIGYVASSIDNPPDTYAQVATHRPDALTAQAARRPRRAADQGRHSRSGRSRGEPRRLAGSMNDVEIDGIHTHYEVVGAGAALDVRAGGLRRHAASKWTQARHLRPHAYGRPSDAATTAASCSTAARRALGRPDRSRRLGRLRRAGARPARPPRHRARAPDRRLHGLLPRRSRFAVAHPQGSLRMLLYWPVGARGTG